MLSNELINIKKSLEQHDSSVREVAYIGIAIGFYDAFLDKNQDVDSLKQLKLLSKVDKDKFLSNLVELTIIDLPLLEAIFSKVEDIKICIRNRSNGKASVGDVYDALGVKELFSPVALEASASNTIVLSSALINSKMLYNSMFIGVEE